MSNMPFEDKGMNLLQALGHSKRLSEAECDTLCPQARKYAERRLKDNSKINPTVQQANLLRRLLVDGRISAAEFETLNASQITGIEWGWRLYVMYSVQCLFQRMGELCFGNSSRECGSEAVLKVLSTPELLERILVYMPAKDLLLKVPLVCKRFQQATMSSLALRRRLFLEPDDQCDPVKHLPFAMLGSRFSRMKHRPAQLDHRHYGCEFSLDLITLKRLKGFDSLGNRFIAQPPLMEASVQVWRASGREQFISSISDGITVGEVLAAVDRIYRDWVESQDELNLEETLMFWLSPVQR